MTQACTRDDQEGVARSDIWFQDGNTVIQVEQRQLKIQNGVLASQSNLFADMFFLPEPPSVDEEALEGCIVTHFSDLVSDIDIV